MSAGGFLKQFDNFTTADIDDMSTLSINPA